MATAATGEVGQLLREWRERRRLTQLELALDSGLSARHLSFVETGSSLRTPPCGGRFGFFRRDLSLNAMTDILGVASGVLLGWLLLFDFPAGASPEVGVYLALAGAVTVATGAGDFRITSWFPRIPGSEEAGT